jgi:sec-independent protein translocase protein TatA
MFGTGEIVVVLVIVVLVFGAGRIPQLFGAVGEGIRNFKKSLHDEPIDVTPKLPDKGQGAPEDPARKE